jgi:branched-chain amino acid transport system ATP-binding protein
VRNVIEWVLDLFPRLRDWLRQLAGLLSGGEQQMLAIGPSAEIAADPKVIEAYLSKAAET